MRFKIAYEGMANKTIAVQTPADALYHIWSRYREDFAGGTIEVGIDEDGRQVRLCQLSFPVRIEREIEAEDPAEAVRTFLYDDRVPATVRSHEITVEPVADPGGEPAALLGGPVRADQDPDLRIVVEQEEGEAGWEGDKPGRAAS